MGNIVEIKNKELKFTLYSGCIFGVLFVLILLLLIYLIRFSSGAGVFALVFFVLLPGIMITEYLNVSRLTFFSLSYDIVFSIVIYFLFGFLIGILIYKLYIIKNEK